MLEENWVKKRIAGSTDVFAGGFAFSSNAHLPTLRMNINGQFVTALLDSGCSRSIVSPFLVPKGKLNEGRDTVTMMNGESV